MNNKKVVKTIWWEGVCKLGQKISEAKQDCIEWFADDMGLEDQKDIFIDGDGRFSNWDRGEIDGKFDPESSVVYYMFEVGLTERAKNKMYAENLIEYY